MTSFLPSEWWFLVHSSIVRHGIKKAREKCCGLHCLVPSFINNTQHCVGKIPFVIPFVLQENSLISVSGVLHIYINVCVCVCAPLLFPSICQAVYWSLPRPQLYSYKWAPLPSNQHWWLEMSNLTAHHRNLKWVGQGGGGVFYGSCTCSEWYCPKFKRSSLGDFSFFPLKHCKSF